MQDLTPVGLSKDGKRLVLIDAAGVEYAVPVDRRLRAALQGDHARLGQLEMKMDSTLRPRDIQNRIRAGESPEDVAAAAQTTLDKIMGFAAPVMAERAHIAESAQASSVRRRSTEAPPNARTLAEAAQPRLRELGLHDQDVSWDAWRRDDGRWAVVADLKDKDRPRRAEFVYDQPGRYVLADNDEARLLTGELKTPAEAAKSGPGSGRRLSAVPSQDELPLGDDAIELVRDVPVTEQVADEATEAEPEPEQPAAADQGHAAAEEQPADGAETEAGAASATGPRAARKKGRASVPTWDEIMFGGGKNE